MLCSLTPLAQIALGLALGLPAVFLINFGLSRAMVGNLRLAGRPPDRSLRRAGFAMFAGGLILLFVAVVAVPLAPLACSIP